MFFCYDGWASQELVASCVRTRLPAKKWIRQICYTTTYSVVGRIIRATGQEAWPVSELGSPLTIGPSAVGCREPRTDVRTPTYSWLSCRDVLFLVSCNAASSIMDTPLRPPTPSAGFLQELSRISCPYPSDSWLNLKAPYREEQCKKNLYFSYERKISKSLIYKLL